MAAFLPIVTPRLVLRRFTAGDAEVLAAYRSHPDVARFQSWAVPYGVDAAHNLIEAQSMLDGPTRGEWIQIATERDGELVGDVAVELSGDGLTATVGYTVAPAHQGRGLATEAVGAVVARLFDELAVHRVQASLDSRNDASARVVERLGFVHEGTAVSSVLEHAEWTDDARYALTEDGHRAWWSRPTGPPVDVRLVEITATNVRDVLALSTHSTQRRFVAPMAASFADACAPEWVDGAPLVPWLRAIEADGELVGFMMLAERTETHPEAYLWRLLIDRRHQRRGIGTSALQLLFERLRAHGHESLLVSWHPGPGGPGPLYERLGFVPTGELEEDEVIARLQLRAV